MILSSLTVFLGALLLFLVQPIIAKLLLPWFGGGAAVWAVCLVFFQAVLFLGYLYAHWSVSRLKPAAQARLHTGILLASLLALPLLLLRLDTPAAGDPALKILALLALMVGLPYFTLSATGPLLQAWFALRGKSAAGPVKPYKLYALSNAGSLLALLGYPFLLEPYLPLGRQLLAWALCYAGFCALCVLTAARVRALPESAAAGAEERTPPPTPRARLLWLALAACPSVLLLAITNHLTQSVAAVPFLWLLPLGLYLFSFIICFGPGEWRWSNAFVSLPLLTILAMAWAMSSLSTDMGLGYLIPLFLAGLFVACLMCHGELARRKPHPDHLTSFYLMIALGGAAGSVFVGLAAPRLFSGVYELQAGIAAYALLAWGVFYRDEPRRVSPAWLFLGLCTAALIVWLALDARKAREDILLSARNFYGALSVGRENMDNEYAGLVLYNGTIVHGAQYVRPEKRNRPVTYYGRNTGIGLLMRAREKKGPRRVGVVGLGAGTMAAYGRRGDYFRFYEINPLVAGVAGSHFSFLGDSAADIDLALGDARLLLQREAAQNFDVLVVDAFSGDAIPVHLLTLEAFKLYFRHLKPDGVLAVHVSSIYLSLEPVVQLAADALGKKAMAVISEEDAVTGELKATWVLVTAREGLFKDPLFRNKGLLIKPAARVKLWTDDFSNLLRILK